MANLRTALVAIGTLLLGAAIAQTDSGPEQTIRQFGEAFFRGDFAIAKDFVVGGKLRPEMDQVAKMLKEQKVSISFDSIDVKTTGATAIATVVTTMLNAGNSHSDTETVNLRLVDGKWKIVPPGANDGEALNKPINSMARAMAEGMNAPFRDAKRAARSTVSLSQVKQLAMATLIYAADWDDVLPKTAAGWHSAIYPYCKNESLFRAPGDAGKGDSYALNPAVAGKNYAKMKFPEQTVMVYEGRKGKLEFRHQGRAAVAFCDGRAKLIDAQEAKKLRWKP